MARTKEQIKADNLALLPSLIEKGATYYGGMKRWIEQCSTKADGLAYLSFPSVLIEERDATAEEIEIGCGYWDDCPCCVCGDDVAKVVVWSEYRWSRSEKTLHTYTHTNYTCGSH